jgi:hypothetical protein
VIDIVRFDYDAVFTKSRLVTDIKQLPVDKLVEMYGISLYAIDIIRLLNSTLKVALFRQAA